MNVTLVSAGMGTADTLTGEAGLAIAAADCVIGAERLLASLPLPDGAARAPLALPEDVVRHLRDNRDSFASAVVVLSGDAGFYSGAKRILELLNIQALLAAGSENAPSLFEVTVIPGVGAVQYFAARLRRPWQDFRLASAHGVDTDVLAEVLNHPCVFFLTGGRLDVGAIIRILHRSGLDDAVLTVGENLAAPTERIVRGTVEELLHETFSSLAVLLVENSRTFTRKTAAAGIPDDDFIRANVPMTKREVRAVAVSLLAPEPADILYDIGAGTGSVSVELANCARRGRVYAIERLPAACELIHKNRSRFGVYNLEVVSGAAPAILESLPPPDRAFIGGSGGDIAAVLAALVGKNPAVRIVAAAICLETVAEVMDAFTTENLARAEVVQVAASRTHRVGGKHLLRAENPIFLLAAGGPVNA
ncbi:MAG: precorrin-6Y C5,15-methyltransferase (decarboxylating) subunit CbiT [Planctomycetes bacterium]|nr:precorrin-6Y C5,15-methyltransferase (decarboxylating) subunit CbiT [Planctomycetota bacterium]